MRVKISSPGLHSNCGRGLRTQCHTQSPSRHQAQLQTFTQRDIYTEHGSWSRCAKARLTRQQTTVQCSASSSNSGGSSSSGQHHSSGSSRTAKQIKNRRARVPGLFEIRVVTPPPKSLGIYSLPPLTHNGEEVEIDGQGYVVTSVVVQMKLNKGKYVRDHSRLDVQPTGRYFLNMSLENLLRAKYIGPTGLQD